MCAEGCQCGQKKCSHENDKEKQMECSESNQPYIRKTCPDCGRQSDVVQEEDS